MMGRWLPGLLACVLTGCGIDDLELTRGPRGDSNLGDSRAGDSNPSSCPRLPAPADRVRKVIVSHPYDASFNQTNIYEVWELSTMGVLTNTGERFEMGRTTGGVIRFTPDGVIGMVAQGDGGIGVFELGAGPVRVIETSYKGSASSFYAADVVIDPSGRFAYVIHAGTRANGGGVYGLQIGCDGSITERGKLTEARSTPRMRFVGASDARAVLGGREVADSVAGETAHLMRWSDAARLDSADAFGHEEPAIASLAVTADGRYALIGDNNEFPPPMTPAHRVSIVEIAGDQLYTIDVLENIQDPVDIVLSPFGNLALVISGYGNTVYQLSYEPTNSVQPFMDLGEVTWMPSGPALPAGAAVIERGALTGHVLIAENIGVHQLQMNPNGTVDDLGMTTFGPALERIVGSVGVQP